MAEKNNDPQWYDVSMAARVTGKSERTVRRWCNKDLVKARKNDSGAWEIRADSLPKVASGPQSRPPDPTTAELLDRVSALSAHLVKTQQLLTQARKQLPPGKKQEFDELKKEREMIAEEKERIAAEKKDLEEKLQKKQTGIEKLKRTPIIRWFIPDELK